jgi:hypothetical protein
MLILLNYFRLNVCNQELDISLQVLPLIVYRLNMPHDDDPKCVRFRDSSNVHNVMSRMLDHKAYPWAWSNCSRHILTEFLE